MDFENVLQQMLTGEKYYTSKELIYDNNVNILLTPFEYKQFLDYKKNNDSFTKTQLYKELELKSFNESNPYIYFSSELLSIVSAYLNLVLDDMQSKDIPLSIRNMDDILLSRIYSEVEGTLNIESVPTTRKVVVEIATGKRDPKTLNEQIIKNMIDGVSFINKCPDFNEDNLYKLYNILSNGCLDEEDKLIDGNIYRHDAVEVGGYYGCPQNKIKECMDSLFSFVNNHLNDPLLFQYLPHIAHYYVLYIHPYFDYNGRTARMVSYWISLLNNKRMFPPVISEAINQTKNQYYRAISESRDSGNDVSYFLLYNFKVAVNYFLTYKNIEEIEQELKNNSVVLSNTDKAYFKKILISNKGKFTYNDFIKWINVDMSKQGALKILNSFCEYGLLNSDTSSSNKKLFNVNEKIIRYNSSFDI